MDPARKRHLRKKAKEDARRQVRESLPLTNDQMRALLSHLDRELPLRGCDQSRRLTLEHLRSSGLDADSVCKWLDQNDGFCDCEVLANCEQAWEDATLGSSDCDLEPPAGGQIEEGRR
jgi:hypothetical protein